MSTLFIIHWVAFPSYFVRSHTSPSNCHLFSWQSTSTSEVVNAMDSPIWPSITLYSTHTRYCHPINELWAALQHVNKLLDVHLQALNEEQYPLCQLPGTCSFCGGKYVLVTNLEVRERVHSPSHDAYSMLGQQFLRVCLAISIFMMYWHDIS